MSGLGLAKGRQRPGQKHTHQIIILTTTLCKKVGRKNNPLASSTSFDSLQEAHLYYYLLPHLFS